jgi:site-specific DNA recombinase
MKAVIYARYSTDLQSAASIEDQVRLCKERIGREGWKLGFTYSDRGMSGADHLRPGYQKLLEDARKGAFDIVVAEALDRISRDQEHVAGFFKQLTFAGVKMVTLAEGEISELHVGLKGTMNALFLKDLADKTRRGLRGRVEAGMSGGGNAYGYSVVRRVNANMEPIRGERKINEGQAAVIRRIFTAFANGQSPRQIAHELNAEKIPCPSGKAWGASTINGNKDRGTGILNNELYIGRMVWNRLRYAKDPLSGRRRSRPNAPDELIIKEVPELRIVDDALWLAVKSRQREIAKGTRPDCQDQKPFWEQARPKYLLSGLAKCGHCGGSFVKISANLFGCATARNKGPSVCDNLLNIRRETMEASILHGLKHRLMDPELFKAFCEGFHREMNRLQIEGSADANAAKSELPKITQQIDKLVMAIANGADARALNGKIKELEARADKLQAMIAAAPEATQPYIHPNLAEMYRQKVADLHVALDKDDCRQEAMELIRSLIDNITLTPKNGSLKITLNGELAGILALCKAGKAKPGRLDPAGLAQQIKMVAGRGFEPLTFRL